MGMEARTVRDVRALKVARDIFVLVFFFYWGCWVDWVWLDWIGLDWVGLVGLDVMMSLSCVLCGTVFGSLIFDWYCLSLSSSLILVNG